MSSSCGYYEVKNAAVAVPQLAAALWMSWRPGGAGGGAGAGRGGRGGGGGGGAGRGGGGGGGGGGGAGAGAGGGVGGCCWGWWGGLVGA